MQASRDDGAAAAVERAAVLPRGEAAPLPHAPRPAARVRTFDIVASGDILLHTPILRLAHDPVTGRYDFRPMFAPIRPIVRRAALALCHVETPIGAGAPSSYPIFNAPRELADAIRWTGWDACSTASNHSVDRGAEGVATTRRHLARVGVRASGTARTRRESRRITLLRVRGLRIALLSYTYGTNGLPLPTPWSVNLISRARVVADARRARRRGADLVLVNFHWGSEYVHAPNAQQRELARFLLRRRVVDAILGQHAHVVQPIRRIARRFVVYGEGNLISSQTIACCASETQNGLIAVLRVRVARARASIARVDYIPIRVRHPDHRVVPVGAVLERLRAAGRGATGAAQELRRSFADTVSRAGRSRFTRPIARVAPQRPQRVPTRSPDVAGASEEMCASSLPRGCSVRSAQPRTFRYRRG